MELSQTVNKIINKSKRNQRQSSFFTVLNNPAATFLRSYLLKFNILEGTKGFVNSVIKSLESFVITGDAYISRRRMKQL